MILPQEIQYFLNIHFHGVIEDIVSINGGCINSTARFRIHGESYFIKWNNEFEFPKMLYKEKLGLDLLQKTNSIRVPRVIFEESICGYSILVLDYITVSNPSPSFWESFGIQLAKLHQNNGNEFGLGYDNYIGSLIQNNKRNADWDTFFIEQRLIPQLDKASGLLTISDRIHFEGMFKELKSIFPKMKPSLLHGDLWNGNFIVGSGDVPWLIDPAVYYGHPEMELAFTKLFGGFDPLFYKGYQSVNQLEKGFSSRVDIYNLYPLLVHVNLFGGGYLQQVRQIIKKF